MKFHFVFQKVLDVKEKEKEQARQEFGSIQRRQTELQEQIDELQWQKEILLNQYNHVHQKTIMEILQVQQDIEHFDQRIHSLSYQCNLIDQEVEQKQQILLDKAKEEKIWSQWKVKSFHAFQKELERREQAMLDEMAVLRYSRKM
jgi:flagellar protein FliJ